MIGHRDTPEKIYESVLAAVEKHIVQYGVTEFLVGNCGAFDRIAARAVIRMKEKYPGIKLVLLLSIFSGSRTLPDGFDDSLYPQGQETVPKRLAIVRANRYAWQHSEYLIAYAWQPGSKAKKLADEAEGRLQVTRIEG